MLNCDQLEDNQYIENHHDTTQNFLNVPTTISQKLILLHQLPSHDVAKPHRFHVEMFSDGAFRSDPEQNLDMPADEGCLAEIQKNCSQETGYVALEEVDNSVEEDMNEPSPLTIQLQVHIAAFNVFSWGVEPLMLGLHLV